MKKTLSYFMAVAFAMTLGLSSCSKEDTPAKDVEKEYAGADILVKNDGVEIPEGVVTIEAIDNTQAKITLTNIVNGHANYQATVPILEKDGARTFTINATEPGMKIAVNGVILDGKAQVVASMEITATEITKAWGIKADFFNSPLAFNLKTKSNSLIYYGNEEPMMMDAAEFSSGIEMMFGMMLPSFLTDLALTFHSNGYVGVKVNIAPMEDGGEAQSFDLPKLARYYYNPTSKMLIFDAPLAGLLPAAKATAPIPAIMQIPFNCSFSESGMLVATIDKSLINMLIPIIPTGEALDALLTMLDPVIPPAFEELLPWLKGNIKTIAEALADSENFESLTIGGRLVEFDTIEKE